MNHIPQSLLDEGFKEDEKEEVVIPDPFQCPVCRELLIEPEMFTCGHTLCKICTSDQKKMYSGSTCPVCRTSSYSTAPNLALRQIIEQQYPEIAKARALQLKEIQDLGSKLATYPRSARYKKMDETFSDLMREHRLLKIAQIVESLLSSQKIQPRPIPAEVEYFIAWKLDSRHQMEFRDIGQLVLYISPDELNGYLDWLKTYNNKEEIMKYSPIVMLTLGRNAHFDEYKKVAEVHNVDIGEKIAIEDWLHKPAFWLKNLDLGEITDNRMHMCSRHHMMPVYIDSDSDEFSDSDSDDYF